MAFNDHQIVQHQLFRVRFTELNEIFAVMSLRSFVCSMIGIFGPIYLFTLGFTIREIFFMHLVMFSVEFLFEYISARMISQFGPKHTIAISMPFLIVHYWLLLTVPNFGWPLWFVGITGGIHLALYWQAYHYDFSKSKHKKEATKDVSRLYIFLAFLGGIAPLIGGVIATNLGFGVLYGLVIGMLFVVFIPLLKSGERHVPKSFSLKGIKLRCLAGDLLAYSGSGMEASTSLVSWPLFVFFIVGTSQNVGMITSGALVLTIVITYLVGKNVNNKNRHGYIRAGSIMDGIIYAMLTLVETFGQIFSLNFARSLVSSLRNAPFVSEYYLHADEHKRAEYIFVMESVIDLVKVFMYGILIFLSYRLGSRELLISGLLFGALGAFFTGFMPRAKCELPYRKPLGIKLIPKIPIGSLND